jgi:hypothetical protein
LRRQILWLQIGLPFRGMITKTARSGCQYETTRFPISRTQASTGLTWKDLSCFNLGSPGASPLLRPSASTKISNSGWAPLVHKDLAEWSFCSLKVNPETNEPARLTAGEHRDARDARGWRVAACSANSDGYAIITLRRGLPRSITG